MGIYVYGLGNCNPSDLKEQRVLNSRLLPFCCVMNGLMYLFIAYLQISDEKGCIIGIAGSVIRSHNMRSIVWDCDAFLVFFISTACLSCPSLLHCHSVLQ